MQYESENYPLTEHQDALQKHGRDAIVDRYFEQRSEIKFIRVPCYRKLSSGRYELLSFSQQFDVAIDLCQQLYFALYDTLAPEVDRDTLLAQSVQSTSNNTEILQRLNKCYQGILTAQIYLQVEGRPHVIVSCSHRHAFQVSLTRAYQFHPSKLDKGGTFCWVCQRQAQFDMAKEKLKATGWLLINEAELRERLQGSICDPLTQKGLKQKIVLHCAHQDDAYRLKEMSLSRALQL